MQKFIPVYINHNQFNNLTPDATLTKLTGELKTSYHLNHIL